MSDEAEGVRCQESGVRREGIKLNHNGHEGHEEARRQESGVRGEGIQLNHEGHQGHEGGCVEGYR